MLTIQYVTPLSTTEAAQPPLSESSSKKPRRRRLRLYLVGSREDTQRAIDHLHVLGYADRIEWSQVIPIPDNGVIIRPDPGDVLRYLQRYRQPS